MILDGRRRHLYTPTWPTKKTKNVTMFTGENHTSRSQGHTHNQTEPKPSAHAGTLREVVQARARQTDLGLTAPRSQAGEFTQTPPDPIATTTTTFNYTGTNCDP